MTEGSTVRQQLPTLKHQIDECDKQDFAKRLRLAVCSTNNTNNNNEVQVTLQSQKEETFKIVPVANGPDGFNHSKVVLEILTEDRYIPTRDSTV